MTTRDVCDSSMGFISLERFVKFEPVIVPLLRGSQLWFFYTRIRSCRQHRSGFYRVGTEFVARQKSSNDKTAVLPLTWFGIALNRDGFVY